MKNQLKSWVGIFGIIGLLGATAPASANPPDIWGAEFIVKHMTLNASGFISWLKVSNPIDVDSLDESDSGARPIIMDYIIGLADGTEEKGTTIRVGTVDANGIHTVSEAALLEAMGNPTQILDALIRVYVENPDAVVLAEKKASDGRVGIPVERVFLLTAPYDTADITGIFGS